MKGQKIQAGQQAFVFILNKSPEKLRQVLHLQTHASVQDILALPGRFTLQPLFRKKREAAPSPRLDALICENRRRVDVRDQWADTLSKLPALLLCSLSPANKPGMFQARSVSWGLGKN